MDYLAKYFISNFILICITIVMYINSILKMKEHKNISIYIIIIMSITFSISIFDAIKEYSQEVLVNVALATFLTSLTYVLKPMCMLTILLLSGLNPKSKASYIFNALLLIAIIIYILPFIPATYNFVFYFEKNPSGTISWASGTTPLRFTSHIIAAIYLGYLIYSSIKSIQSKHLLHAANVFICSIIIIVAVIIDTFFNGEGLISLTNTSMAISVVFYYVYLYTEKGNYDPLTHLFNRAMYYSDLPRMEKNITGIIQIDMNGLKYINDNIGHLEGDVAIKIISSTILKCSTKKMYAYRLGGDEFTVLCVKETEENIINVIDKIRYELIRTKYSASIGYAYRDTNDLDLKTLSKIAEAEMYRNKEEFYKTSTFERRESVPTNIE